MRRILLALLALVLLRADMYPDASNAKLPQARVNLGGGKPISVMDHGAKGDAITLADSVIAAGSTTLSAWRANFTQADVGKKIQIEGAAGVYAPPLRTTIAAVINATTITLATPAVEATPRFVLPGIGTGVASSGSTGSYVPGELLTLVGGTYTTPATIKVIITKVRSVAIAAAGANGVNGPCRVQGTTGNGTLFHQDVTISGGAITALGSLYIPGYYFTNPTNPAAEPVANAPGYNCAPTGATLNVAMGLHHVVSVGGKSGNYDPAGLPPDPISTTPGSISGATGATVNTGGQPWGWFVPTGYFVYGTDDSQALKDSTDAAVAQFAAGKQSYVFLPAGNYLIDSVKNPMVASGLGFIGEGTYRTNIILGSNYVGDLFSWSEAWAGGGHFHGLSEPLISNTPTGPKVVGMAIWGSRSAPAQQNAISFYDRNDQVFIDDVDIGNITGHCMRSGIPNIPGYPSSMRESIIGRMRCGLIGAPGIPAIEFRTTGGGDADDEININDINIYAHHGDAFVLNNESTTGNPTRNFRINKLRIEGSQQGDLTGDHIRLGGPTSVGPITGIWFDQLELLTPYANRAAFRTTGPGDIYYNSINSGHITSGMPMGYGFVFESGRNLSVRMSGIYTWNTNVTTGPSFGGGLFLDVNGDEQILTYNVANPRHLSTPARKIGLPGYTVGRDSIYAAPSMSPVWPDDMVRGGTGRGPGAIDWQMSRQTADQVASGSASVIGGGDTNKISSGGFQATIAGGTGNVVGGPLGVIGGGLGNVANGFNTTIPGGTFGNDRGAAGGMFLGAPNGCQPFQISGACQRSWHVLGAFPNTAAAIRLTSDGGVPVAGGANCVPIPYGSIAYQTVVRATLRNWNANENASWNAIEGMLAWKSGWPVQYLGAPGGAPSFSTGGTHGTLTVGADDTNKCLAVTYTPPAGNTDTIHIVATVDLTEVQ